VLLTIDSYENISYMGGLSKKYSSMVGKKIDIYWNNEAHNYIVTKHGERGILTEFLERQPIYIDQIRRRFWELENRPPNGEYLKKELSLQEIAVKANKEKDLAEKREQFEYAGGEIYDYDVAGKRSVMVSK
jgi:hypothetical protein